jgi:osmotically-inducible protein OsmY
MTAANPNIPHSIDVGADADADIHRNLEATLKTQPQASVAHVNFLVRHRAVLLWGCIDGKEQREALVLAAESIPGVRSVKDYLLVVGTTPRIAFATEGD